MKTERQIQSALKRCRKVANFGMSKGPCPQLKGRVRGCCAECSFPSTLSWVLEEGKDATANGQKRLMDIFKDDDKTEIGSV